MSHSFVHCLLHVVFSTHHRRPLIDDAWSARLHDVMGSIARERGFPVIAVGGVADHVHLLMTLPSAKPIAECMRLLKANSSKWVNDTFFPARTFAWQDGYGAFSIAQSQVEATVAYIRAQAEHHRERSFQEEFREFLTRQGMAWDERYVWG
ncbi:MAG: IS200/IS605 family transposase [Planctomycetes bacterium]|nr:IS200/IS605 family transposase [Planctomycetota bacterium]